jgi:DNA-nicking Smr family endonuclease
MKSKPPVLPDFDLWADVTRTIRPLKPLRRARKATPAAKPAPASPSQAAPREHKPAPSRPARPAPSGPPPLTGLDRKSERRMTRGQVEIEARIDLHGTGIEQARVRLLQFLNAGRARGVRLVLVITGKGESPFARHTLHGATHFHTPERQGRLRRLVPEWLHEPEFRLHVAGFQPAHPRHGGGGAFYVKLRRQERGRK